MEIGVLLLILTVFGIALVRKSYKRGTLTRRPIIDERGRGYLESSPFRTGRPAAHFSHRPGSYYRNAL